MKVDGTDPKYGDWRDDLVRDGYAIIKGAIPKERALNYADRMYALAESLYVYHFKQSSRYMRPILVWSFMEGRMAVKTASDTLRT
jgi:hypothetical protein